MFKEDLFNLRKAIYEIANKTPKKRQRDVIENILNQKLERNYQNYAEMITSKINYILSRNNYRVIKSLNKLTEENDESLQYGDEIDE